MPRFGPPLALLLAACAGGPALAQAPTVLSLAEGTPDGRVRLQPIAVVTGDALAEPPATVEEQAEGAAFLAAHFAPGSQHGLLVAGRRVGRFTVGEAGPSDGVSGFYIWGGADSEAALPLAWTGLSLVERAAPTALRRPLTADERAAFLAVAEAEVAARWGPDFNEVALGAELRAFAVETAAGPALVGSVTTHSMPGRPLFAGDPWEPTPYAAFVIAERDADGRYRAVARRLAETSDYVEGGGYPELLDVADVVGDAAPEVVVEIGFYEGAQYGVWGRTAGGWALLYEGGYFGL